ncbi:MAG: hypothetical protein PHU71_05925 [Candidatus Gracilibacteria bacterium]|nr:hypothetical protein [Candidatus Gracilibacteria bacterium]
MNLEQSIIATLAFFDVLEMPLKAPQVRQFLIDTEASLEATQKMLDDITREKKIECWFDYYSLVDKGRAFQSYQNERKRISAKFLAKIRRFRFLFAMTPYLRGAFIVNSLAFGNSDQGSDIDFLIVTKEKRLWLTRLWITILTQLLGVRRHGEKVAGRFCLSFFVSEEALNLEALSLKLAGHQDLPQDPYLMYWIRTVKPVIGAETYMKFQEANSWVKPYLPNLTSFRAETIFPRPKFARLIGRVTELILEITLLGSLLEKILQKTLKKHTLRKRDELRDKRGTVISDSVLKFHNQDWRQLVFDEWLDRLEKNLKGGRNST